MGPIGIFDSGYGGLTVLKEIVNQLPEFDFLYLGDNARTPYGTRSYETVYQYTRQCVKWMFDKGCPLVILACNTASAKALRTIQQKDLPGWQSGIRVLGVIRPTAETIGSYSKTGKVGILATRGTVVSDSYPLEIKKFFPAVHVFQQACPLWVPIIENNLMNTAGAEYFIKSDVDSLMEQNAEIDTLLLGCTHYPLILDQIQKFLPSGISIISQGKITALSLADYIERHKEIAVECSRESTIQFFTTDSPLDFDKHSALFFGKKIQSTYIELG